MADLVIPGWAVVLISGVGSLMLGWNIYLTIKTFENKQSIAINTATDQQVSEDLKRIYRAIDETKQSFTTDLKELRQELGGKIDMLLSNDLTYLKTIRLKD